LEPQFNCETQNYLFWVVVAGSPVAGLCRVAEP